ncbi:hypothetical protein DAEQUDRAFT_301112 [Daedalea quercina L-15889]|uniref:Uncharacterized protein n=1 Tax=Daedalea quercina L-15889 TaxID=1314783 RepID=A0A165Q5S1_9APHY|nr:hypothetical protein DAEQUDRAFT_301112 [Daedalea quercina L-15889]
MSDTDTTMLDEYVHNGPSSKTPSSASLATLTRSGCCGGIPVFRPRSLYSQSLLQLFTEQHCEHDNEVHVSGLPVFEHVAHFGLVVCVLDDPRGEAGEADRVPCAASAPVREHEQDGRERTAKGALLRSRYGLKKPARYSLPCSKTTLTLFSSSNAPPPPLPLITRHAGPSAGAQPPALPALHDRLHPRPGGHS